MIGKKHNACFFYHVGWTHVLEIGCKTVSMSEDENFLPETKNITTQVSTAAMAFPCGATSDSDEI